eukprot:Phypoly_transcript_08958.p2 GENE.Phypoly_transcript_08958~~Phypoly_transcript_08958.p2  ORF type:complete len:100 (+),score=30.13 Phypoly_transcript_08958:1100-1399(+)
MVVLVKTQLLSNSSNTVVSDSAADAVSAALSNPSSPLATVIQTSGVAVSGPPIATASIAPAPTQAPTQAPTPAPTQAPNGAARVATSFVALLVLAILAM